jgi:hypothetical protein
MVSGDVRPHLKEEFKGGRMGLALCTGSLQPAAATGQQQVVSNWDGSVGKAAVVVGFATAVHVGAWWAAAMGSDRGVRGGRFASSGCRAGLRFSCG